MYEPAGLRRHVPQILFTAPFQVRILRKILQPGKIVPSVVPDDLLAVDPVQDLPGIGPDLRQARREGMLPHPDLQSREDQDVWKLSQVLVPKTDRFFVL